jgi:NADPH2:quinone reductase
MKAIHPKHTGGPEVLVVEEVSIPAPGPNQVLVRVAAAGVNYIDVYHRTGLYPMLLPIPIGLEGAGVVERLGEAVSGVKVGDRVAWSAVPGSYASHVVAPIDKLLPVPDGVSLETAAAIPLQGMTAHYLTRTVFPLGKGHTILVHAAAGGVGLLLIQVAKRAGARVIGTTSTEAKAALAEGVGADHVINYTTSTDFASEVKRLTGDRGVDVVYDSVGKVTFDGSLDSLAPRGTLVLFGQASGPVPPFDPLRLSKGSYCLARPSLQHYTATRAELLMRGEDVFGMVARGELQVRIDKTFPLAQAAEAHRALTGRATTGKVLLIP